MSKKKAMRKNSKGFHLTALILVLVVVAVIGLVGWKVFTKKDTSKSKTSSSAQTSRPSAGSSSETMWGADASGNWTAFSAAPACPAQPMLKLPADLAKVTSILYPGQTRGGDYKPHGGFRFDKTSDNSVNVSAPMDAYVYRGSRYLVNGETQYLLDFINSCGVMYRLGHLLVLTPKYQALADKFPAAQEGDSRTTNVEGNATVKAGELVATKVGVTVGGANTFFDFGVYDLRSTNAAAKDPSYLQKHDLGLAGHAVCWLKDWFPASDEAIINGLPASDPTSAKNSDYCA